MYLKMFYITQNQKMCYSYKNKKSQKEKITEKDNQHNNTNNKKLYKNESFEI